MADHGQSHRRLDASGPREVVYCHLCRHEWYHDEHDLICPNCSSEITEIVTPESDPRPTPPATPELEDVPIPPDFHAIRGHNPWADDDPEEADIEEHSSIRRGPGGSIYISQTIRPRPGAHSSRRPRNPPGEGAPDVMRDFQEILGTLMGPGIRQGQAGRSGPDDLFPPPAFARTFRVGGGAHGGPAIVGGRFTYTTGQDFQPRNPGGPQDARLPVDELATYASPSSPPQRGRSLLVVSVTAPPDQLASILGNLLGQLRPPPEDRRDEPGGMPRGLHNLFATILNPANARHGDAVYSQEALDQIISTLMEQHPTSNAPGPASPDAIAALPKKKLEEKELGAEGKGECSVCMDDVFIGYEVVSLPCSHWFHEQCASAWLSEHNTCPICRKGIDGQNQNSQSSGSTQAGPTPGTARSERRSRGLGQFGSRSEGPSSRNEARLNSIRNTAGLASEEPDGGRRWQFGAGDQSRSEPSDRMPGAFRRRSSGLSVENQRDRDRDRESRRNTSGSDRSRDSQRSSHEGNGNGGNGGVTGWLRDRFSRRD